jgi:hypothetical protein
MSDLSWAYVMPNHRISNSSQLSVFQEQALVPLSFVSGIMDRFSSGRLMNFVVRGLDGWLPHLQPVAGDLDYKRVERKDYIFPGFGPKKSLRERLWSVLFSERTGMDDRTGGWEPLIDKIKLGLEGKERVTIKHPTLGEGQVLRFSGERKITVAFGDTQKNLDLSYIWKKVSIDVTNNARQRNIEYVDALRALSNLEADEMDSALTSESNPFTNHLQAALTSENYAEAEVELDRLYRHLGEDKDDQSQLMLRERLLGEAFQALVIPSSEAAIQLEKGRDVIVSAPLDEATWVRILSSPRERMFTVYRFLGVDYMLIRSGVSAKDMEVFSKGVSSARAHPPLPFYAHLQADGHSHPQGRLPTPSDGDERYIKDLQKRVERGQGAIPIFIVSLIGEIQPLHVRGGTLTHGYNTSITFGNLARQLLKQWTILAEADEAPSGTMIQRKTREWANRHGISNDYAMGWIAAVREFFWFLHPWSFANDPDHDLRSTLAGMAWMSAAIALTLMPLIQGTTEISASLALGVLAKAGVANIASHGVWDNIQTHRQRNNRIYIKFLQAV